MKLGAWLAGCNFRLGHFIIAILFGFVTPCNLVCCTRFRSNVLLPRSLFFLTLDICVCVCVCACMYMYMYIYIYIYIYQNKRSRNHIFTVVQRHSCFEALSQICENRIVASSVLLHGMPWLPLEEFSWNHIVGIILLERWEKFNFGYNLTKISGSLCEDLSIRMTCLVTSGIMVGVDVID
jgi:hypothetical protein